MKKITTIIILLLTLIACKNEKEKSIQDILSTNNLSIIKKHKEGIVAKQQAIAANLKLLDNKIAELDTDKKIPLISTFTVKETVFNHYLELQGNVSTKNLLVIYPEYSGILTRVYVKAGQQVKKGQLLAKIDDGGMSPQLAQLQIQANLAKTTFERQARLWEQKIGSEIQYLQAKSNANAQQKAVQQMQKMLAKTRVKAPFSGTIDEIITEQGSVVAPGMSPLMRIVNLNKMHIETSVPESHITHVIKGKNVVVNFPVLGKTIHAKINQVGSYINPSNRTFKVEINIPNKDKSIKPNLTAKLKINDYSNAKALLIPQSIISENAIGEQYIYIVENKTAKMEAIVKKIIITTGKTKGDDIEILSGLHHGNEIIKDGARTVKEGQNVRIVK